MRYLNLIKNVVEFKFKLAGDTVVMHKARISIWRYIEENSRPIYLQVGFDFE